MRFLKSTLIKKILGVVLIMGCSGIFLNGYVGIGESAHAQFTQGTINNDTTGTAGNGSMSTMGLREILNMVLKIIYLLLWPLLVVAGLALDNTLVYASIFHLDAPLWKFWNMMKNFANFALGFMVLFAIIKSILTNSGAGSAKDEKTPLGIIKTTLIAGVLIQASWFLMAAAVDISTIATYAVGGLPLSVLKDTAIGKQKILSVNSSINLNKFDVLNKKGEGFRIRYSTMYNGKPITMSPCMIKENFIIGRQYGDSEFNNSDEFKGDKEYEGYEVCVLYSNKLVMWKENDFMGKIATYTKNNLSGSLPPYTSSSDDSTYQLYMRTLPRISGWQNLDRVTNTLVNIDSGSSQATKDGFTKGSNLFISSASLTISDLINKSKGFVGPLVTIYSSLLNFTQLTDANVTTLGETSGIFIIKSLVAIALFFPLIALALVLIARIGVLRLYIVASPFIILKACFKDFLKMDKLDEYLSIKSVGGIIFAPVITVAALSISLIFMTALVNGFTNSASNEQIQQAIGTQKITPTHTGNDAISFGGIAQLEFTKLPRGEATDRFSRLMINFFAIGLMRMIFFAALKANKLGKAIGEPVQKFGENVFQTMPILPIGQNGSRVGLGSAAKVLGGAPDTRIRNRESEQKRIASDFVFGAPTTTPTGTTFNPTPIVAGLGKLTNPTEEKVKEVFTTQGITNPSENITTNSQIYYDALKNIKNEDERQKVIQGIEVIPGQNGFWNNMVNKEATTNFEAKVKIEKNSGIDDLTTTVNKSDNKDIMENLLKAYPKGYTKEVDGIKFTITKDNDKYKVTSETITKK